MTKDSAPSAPLDIKICGKCATPLAAGNSFCHKCGSSVA